MYHGKCNRRELVPLLLFRADIFACRAWVAYDNIWIRREKQHRGMVGYIMNYSTVHTCGSILGRVPSTVSGMMRPVGQEYVITQSRVQ